MGSVTSKPKASCVSGVHSVHGSTAADANDHANQQLGRIGVQVSA